MRTTIEMAREAGFTDGELAFMQDNFLLFAELVRADERAAQAAARIAITHLQAVLNTSRTHAEQQAADTRARDWLISIGSEPA